MVKIGCIHRGRSICAELDTFRTQLLRFCTSTGVNQSHLYQCKTSGHVLFLLAFIQWYHAGPAGFFIHLHHQAALAALCKPHHACVQEQHAPTHIDDFGCQCLAFFNENLRPLQMIRLKCSGLPQFSRVHKTQRIRKISNLMHFTQQIMEVWMSH